MRKFTKLVVAFTLMGFTVGACNEAKKNPDGDSSEQTEMDSDSSNMEETKGMESTTVLNANLATEEDLNGIGLSSELVTAILEQRPFLDMDAFNSILGTKTNKSELYTKIFVPLNLNTTAEADFKMVPGVGDRMAHEFEEYRPYESIKQFRREIGKYVDEAEVARYENYVFVPVELNSASEEDIKALPGVGNRMAHEFEEYRPYANMEQFRKEIGKYVDEKELSRLERFVYLKE
ncbi:Competence protein ComEA related helix-hairpin-helix domain [Croceitalea dokdonensis DOKDO 023]|uniref:Competence protein ComEA related helix-hairpin-helix domain n=1 Tax=Croceitalea dokdonensis DOKDO 023 TaxID=1300341 RepID=A0A0P7AUU7_9FLAO|nr:helix-hairpin-helix domain-containing protein [Croceitalea dokdonensis]KPM32310.1 Competence protein ComEA related helix-hairpin-helix domain [Croceitalea dokdonensis DOKDO 023]